MDKVDNRAFAIAQVVAGGFYDLQGARIRSSNQIRGLVRTWVEGVDTSKPAPEKEDGEKARGKVYNDEKMKLMLAEMVASQKLGAEESEYITALLNLLKSAEKQEKAWVNQLGKMIEHEPMWTEFLIGVKGISTILTANLLREFAYCERYGHVSGLWKWCGLDVVNGVAPKLKRGEKIGWSPRCKTLCWKISDSFIKQRTWPYREVYDVEKAKQLERLEAKTADAPKSKLHAENRARRKAAKMFLQHYWLVGRMIKGLPVDKPYVLEHLAGHDTYLVPVYDQERKMYVVKKVNVQPANG
jgi:hypothetical protein